MGTRDENTTRDMASERMPSFDMQSNVENQIQKVDKPAASADLISKKRTNHKPTRHCVHCKKPIVSNALKALGSYYHEECLVCYDCGSLCKPKYFPYEIPDTKQMVLLCQKHYFTRNDLLCYICQEPLSGVYFSTFGKMYDEEHFCCSICGEKCKVDACFHNDNQLYCRYHFLKYVSRRCKGCSYPISDQYIEFPKGDDLECWHTECYGIHKYWHVTISPESLGLPFLKEYELKSLTAEKDSDSHAHQIENDINSFNTILSKIWTVLYRFEEETAACISDMFQYLTSFDQSNGINAVALFVLKVECLFKALDSLDSLKVYHTNSPMLTEINPNSEGPKDKGSSPTTEKRIKYPNSLSTKIMIYLQLLRKLSSDPNSEPDVNLNSFMSVITGIAQFLKLLIRQSLSNALDYCKSTHSSNALIKYLREIEKNESIYERPFDLINIPIDATDSCAYCEKYIKDACIQCGMRRWHKECLRCSSCGQFINDYNFSEAAYNKITNTVLCARCSVDDPDSKVGFKAVTKLDQLIFLLSIALVRSKTVMEYNDRSVTKSNDMKKSISMQQTYIRTLNDIKRLKSRRTSMRVSNNREEARKSRVIETEEMFVNQDASKEKDLIIETDQHTEKKSSTLFEGPRSLTLDDISRIVAAEQARDLRPNAFAHFKTLKEDGDSPIISKKSGVYYSELTPERYSKLQMIALTLLVQDGLITDQIKPPDALQKLNGNLGFWTKFKTVMTGKDNKKIVHKKVFGTPLEYLTAHCGVESDQGIGPAKLKIPMLIDELISNLRQLDMSVEGVFRKNGNIRRLRELAEEIDSDPQHCPNLSNENAIQLSALLKKFLRELPIPLLTFQFYNQWIMATKVNEISRKQRLLALLYTMLPIQHRNVSEVLFSFLFWASSFSHVDNQIGSKMDIHNLSTVIAPNILYQDISITPKLNINKQPEAYADAFAQNEGEEYFLAIEAVDYIINHHEELSMVPNYLLKLLEEVEGQNLMKPESIGAFVKKKLKDNLVDFQYNSNFVQVKESTTKVKINE